MRILTVYSSMKGNTKKIAEAIVARLSGDKALCDIDEAPEPRDFDLIFLGFWLMAGKPDPRSLDFFRRITNQKLFLFATHGAAADSDHAHSAISLAQSTADSARIIGTFNCQGEISPGFLEKARVKDPQPVWIGDAENAVGHQNDDDIRRLNEVLKTLLPEATTL